MPRLLSLNVGLPRDVSWQGRVVRTAIWKTPVEGRRVVRRLNIDGDDQADRQGHGGEHRAVFVYQLDVIRDRRVTIPNARMHDVGLLTLLPVAGIGWWLMGSPPGWGWMILPTFPPMPVSPGMLLVLGTVVVGCYGGLVWARDHL